MANGDERRPLEYELADSARQRASDAYVREDSELDEAFKGPYPADSKQYKRRMQRAHKARQRAKFYEGEEQRINKSARRRTAQRDEKRSR